MAIIGTLTAVLIAETKNFSANLKKASEDVSGFASKTRKFLLDHKILIGAAVTGLVAFTVKAIKEFGEEEKAIVALTQSLKNQGITSLAVVEDLKQYASSLQKITTFSDNSILSMQTQLVTFGLTGDALKKTTKTALDFAAATGTDLTQSAKILGKAFVGVTGELSRHGIIIDENIPKNQKFNAILKQLEERFGGQAEAERNTTLGQWKALNNVWENTMGIIGGLVGGPLTKLAEISAKQLEKVNESIPILKEFSVEILQQLGKEFKQLAEDHNEFARDFTNTMKALISKSTGVLGFRLEMQRTAQVTGRSWDVIEGGAKEVTGSIKEQSEQTKKTAVDWEALQQRIINATIVTTEDLRSEYLKRTDAANESFENTANFSQQFAVRMAEDTKSWNTIGIDAIFKFRDAFASGMADMILEGGKFKDAMEQIGKDILRIFIEEVIKRMVAAWITAMVQMAVAQGLISGAGAAAGTEGAGAGLIALGLPVAIIAAIALLGGQAITGHGTFGEFTRRGFGGRSESGRRKEGIQAAAEIFRAKMNKPLNMPRMVREWLQNRDPDVLFRIMSEEAGTGPEFATKWLPTVIERIEAGDTAARIVDILTHGHYGPLLAAAAHGAIIREPAIFRTLRSGKMGIMGEAGPEAIIPLGGRGMGITNLNITISGQFVEADEAKWDRLIRAKLIPQIDRINHKRRTGII